MNQYVYYHVCNMVGILWHVCCPESAHFLRDIHHTSTAKGRGFVIYRVVLEMLPMLPHVPES